MTLLKNSIYLNGRSKRDIQEWWTLKNGATECKYESCCAYSASNLVSVHP
jgi:hypothetical protein